MTKRYLLAAFLITQMVCGVVAQQPSATPPPVPALQTQKPDDLDVVKITSNLVQVDAVVLDKDGKPVTDLRLDEVQILEDGKPQSITHFSFNGTGAETTATPPRSNPNTRNTEVAAPVKPEPLTRSDVHRTMVIVIDDLGLSFESISVTRRALKKFVDEQMQPGDLVAIVLTGKGIGSLQQFSSDKRQIYAAIERVRWNPMGRSDTGAFSAIRGPELKIPDEAVSRNQAPEAYREEVFSVGTLGAINYVVRGLREMPGRKSVVLFSDGLKIFNPGDPARTSRVQDALDKLVDLSNRASVVIYTMDARGLTPVGLQAQDNLQISRPVGRNPGLGGPTGVTRNFDDINRLMASRRESFSESQNGLNYLAEQTGGLPIRNTNDLSAGIQRILDDQRGYYLIGYRPDEMTFTTKAGQPKFHNLSLKVTRRGKFDVRIRNGFLGISDEAAKLPAEKTAAEQLLAAITSPFSSAGIHLQLTSLFANDLTNGSFVHSMLHISAQDLTFKDGPNGTHDAVFDVLAMTFGLSGDAVDYVGRTFTASLPDDAYQRALRQGLVYNVTVPIKQSGAYQFRISLRDAGSNRIGSASQFIEVPDLSKNRLTLSGVVLNNTPINSGTDAGSKEAGSQNSPETSPAVRRFKQGTQMEYGYLIYNAQPDKTTQKPSLTTQLRLFRDGKQVFAGTERPFDPKTQADLKRLAASGGLILGTDLIPGEYVLQLIVTDALADKKYRVATQWMDFEIVK